MVIEDAYSKILECLKKEGQANTFRLTSKLGIDRHKILNIIKKLEEKQAVEFKSGTVKFLKFPEKDKKAAKIVSVKIAPTAQKAKLSEKIKLLGSIQHENKELNEKLSELEGSVKRQHYTKSKKFREQAELIEKLENRIEILKQKAKVPPKIITKTVVKRIIKKVPVEVIKKVLVRVKEREAKPKFKLPKINLPSIKNIQQLKRPEFLEQKITAKVNFSGLNKNIQQLHVPEMLRNL